MPNCSWTEPDLPLPQREPDAAQREPLPDLELKDLDKDEPPGAMPADDDSNADLAASGPWPSQPKHGMEDAPPVPEELIEWPKPRWSEHTCKQRPIEEGPVSKCHVHTASRHQHMHKCHFKMGKKPTMSRKHAAQSLANSKVMLLNWGTTLDGLRSDSNLRHLIKINCKDNTIKHMNPHALAAKTQAGDTDNPNWNQVMNGLDCGRPLESSRGRTQSPESQECMGCSGLLPQHECTPWCMGIQVQTLSQWIDQEVQGTLLLQRRQANQRRGLLQDICTHCKLGCSLSASDPLPDSRLVHLTSQSHDSVPACPCQGQSLCQDAWRVL